MLSSKILAAWIGGSTKVHRENDYMKSCKLHYAKLKMNYHAFKPGVEVDRFGHVNDLY